MAKKAKGRGGLSSTDKQNSLGKKPSGKKPSGKKPSGKKPSGKKPSGKRTWKMMDRGATLASGIAGRKILAVTWHAAVGKKPPTNTRHPELSNREAIAWAIFGGAGSELARVLIRRQTASYWVRSTGKLPPGMKPLKNADETGAKVDVVEAAAARAARGRHGRTSS